MRARAALTLSVAVLLAVSVPAAAQLVDDQAVDDTLGQLPETPDLSLDGAEDAGASAADGAQGAFAALGAVAAAIAEALATAGSAAAEGVAAGGQMVADGAVLAVTTSAGIFAVSLLAAGEGIAAVAGGIGAAGAAVAGAIGALSAAIGAAVAQLFRHPALSDPAMRFAASAALASVPASGATAAYVASPRWTAWLKRLVPWLKRIAPFAGMGLYSRIQKDNVLDNPVRERIYRYIQDHPGAHVSKISDALELGWGTTVHHLKHLERHDMVSVRKARNHTCYFENGGTFSPSEQEALAALKNEKARRIAEYIRRSPGASQKEIAGDLDLSQSLVSWHVNKLEDAGLIGRERNGKAYELQPADPLLDILGTAQ